MSVNGIPHGSSHSVTEVFGISQQDTSNLFADFKLTATLKPSTSSQPTLPKATKLEPPMMKQIVIHLPTIGDDETKQPTTDNGEF